MCEFNLNGKPLMDYAERSDTLIFLTPFMARSITLITILLLTAHLLCFPFLCEWQYFSLKIPEEAK